MVVVTESGEWLSRGVARATAAAAAGDSSGTGDGGGSVVPVVAASDGVAVSLLRKAGLLDTANAAGPLRVV